MKPTFPALTIATSLSICAPCMAAPTHVAASAPTPVQTSATNATSHTTVSTDRNSDAPVTLNAVSVTATLNRARNGLSPETGSSQYVIGTQAIQALPLGASTPLNQVLLQAPGVVQDAYGQLHVRGDHGNLQYRINGVMLPESISGFGQTLDTRMIQRVKLLDGALPAQYGERTAAVVDITTRNGFRRHDGGNVGITGGSFGRLNPHGSLWGHTDRMSWYLTANYLTDDVGVASPTPGRNPIHDHTNQLKTFGNLTWLLDDHTRLNVLFGTADNRFEVPDNPGQQPRFGYLDRTGFDSATLDERQQEKTRFAVLSLQGRVGRTDYQISLARRYSAIHFHPDRIGDLMFNGVASRIDQDDRATTLQADLSMPLNDSNTLRYGFYGKYDKATTNNNVWVFPAHANGNQASTTPFAIATHGQVIAKTWAAYIQDEWAIAEDWTVNYGLRGDIYKAFDRTQSQLSPRIGVVWQATPGTTVHAGYARYFTPPATELISSQDINAFKGTTNAVTNYGNNKPLAERSNYYDLGISQRLGRHLTLGLDAYYRQVHDIQDEGQFGAALVYATFNYRKGSVKGLEFTASYHNGPWDAYFNAATTRAMGKRVVTSQYNFGPADLAYIHDHWIYLDHDQKLTSSGGLNYTFAGGTRLGANYLFGSGLRKDGAVPNGATMPAYFQLNLSVSHDFSFGGSGPLHTQLAVINALDRVYALHDGTGIGVGAPQYGPRRGVYLSVSKDF